MSRVLGGVLERELFEVLLSSDFLGNCFKTVAPPQVASEDNSAFVGFGYSKSPQKWMYKEENNPEAFSYAINTWIFSDIPF